MTKNISQFELNLHYENKMLFCKNILINKHINLQLFFFIYQNSNG
jgi:hypothetical protein